MSRIQVFVYLAVSMLFINCSRQEPLSVALPYDGLVDARLIPYFQTFEREAALRGIDIDLENYPVAGAIRGIQEDDIAGTCSYHYTTPNDITIDLEYWNGVSTLRREMVVFHELGHCVLGRDHLETAFANGICTTIMNSGTSGCFVEYSAENRSYYLDELFAD
jgi:hypothetical protein